MFLEDADTYPLSEVIILWHYWIRKGPYYVRYHSENGHGLFSYRTVYEIPIHSSIYE